MGKLLRVQVIANITSILLSDVSGPPEPLWALRITIGLGNNTEYSLANSSPIPLFPGVHLEGAISISFMQEYSSGGIATLGLSGVSISHENLALKNLRHFDSIQR